MNFRKDQLISYLGNKRSLIKRIETNHIKPLKEIYLKKDKVSTLDLFSGSGVVARMLKKHSSIVYANDLEEYSAVINQCFLNNVKYLNDIELKNIFVKAQTDINILMGSNYSDWVRSDYCPKNESNIKASERVFYTVRNGRYLDCCVKVLNAIKEPYRSLLWGPILSQASKYVNTAAMFKGFYKDSKTGIGKYGGTHASNLNRILKDINLELPILSNYHSKYKVYREDANLLIKKLPLIDITYLDPPYNQHPYASNYFMLNHLLSGKRPQQQSVVVGIPKTWNKSKYNYKQTAIDSIKDCITNLNSQFIILSYSTSGFITKTEMESLLLPFTKKRCDGNPKHFVIEDINYTNLSCGKTKQQKDKDKTCTEFIFRFEKHI